MKWQDIVFALGAFIFVLALTKMVNVADKPPAAASMPIALTLFSFAVAYASLRLPLAATMTAVQAVLWGVLYFQAKHATVPETNKEL